MGRIYRPSATTANHAAQGFCPGGLDPRDEHLTLREPTKQERKLLGNGWGWGFDEPQPTEFTSRGLKVKRPKLRCYSCGGRFAASYMVDHDGDYVHFRLPAHKPNRVGRRLTKKVFDQKGNRK